MKAPMSTDELLEFMDLKNEQEKEQYLDKICDREIARLATEKKNVEDMEIKPLPLEPIVKEVMELFPQMSREQAEIRAKEAIKHEYEELMELLNEK